ncbi:MAG: thioredoxin family protein [Planctomycetota bacterium]
MLIEILGTCCTNCVKTHENAKEAVKELGVEADVVHVTEISEIAKRGVAITPGLVIDGKVVSTGKPLSVDKIKELIQKHKK